MVYDEFCNNIDGNIAEDKLRSLFELVYNKGYEDGKSALSRGVNSMFLPHYDG